jgi:predicted transcriptional regulator
MSRRAFDDLGELQKAVLEVVWALGEATVNQAKSKLGRRKLAYTTVLSVMQKLEAKSSSLRQFINRVCGGDPLAMFQHLLDAEELTVSDLAELRKMIDKRRKELSHD